MRTRVGLWIDHTKAVVVAVNEKGEEAGLLVLSKARKHPERSGDRPLKGRYEARQVPADDRRQNAFTGNLNIYYEAVIACLRDAEAVFIFGPGEAKGELVKRLKKDDMGERIVGTETADKLTDRQIAAKVRLYFKKALAAPSAKTKKAI
ncbi:MAG: hypothetical protein HQL28_03815 [Candidatus Omnitrophica bacterium]|nr:hypothetical protein [Candidatus Omnitrophota bacterium]